MFFHQCERPGFTPIGLLYKTIGKNIFLHILSFVCLESKWEDKIFCTEWQQVSALNFFLNAVLIVLVVSKYLNFAKLSKDLLSILML
jgi:hypothetical protein